MAKRAARPYWTAKEDALAQLLAGRGVSHRQIADLVGRAEGAVTSRLHLLRRGLKARPWSPAEDALIRDTAGYRTAADIAAEIGRTPAAVNTRAEVLHVRWNRSNGRGHTGLTAIQVAQILGVACSKSVARWIERGYLAASRRAPRLGANRGRLVYRVMPDALRAFLRDYPWLYDRARITDRGWAAWVAANVPREEWVGTREAAHRLCLTVEAVADIIRKGDLRAEKVGANWAIPTSAIRAYEPPPIGVASRCDQAEWAHIQARRHANLAARRSATYRLRPETVAAARASRAARRAVRVNGRDEAA